MKFINGLPVEDNASDKQDSVRLAGICNVFGYRPYAVHPQPFDMRRYFLPAGTPIFLRDQPKQLRPAYDIKGREIVPAPAITYFDKDLIVRSPDEYAFDLSRDQWICFVGAAPPNLIDRKYLNGKDLMSPTIDRHEAVCKGLKTSLWQDMWLIADILAYAAECVLEPDEPNQLLVMVRCAGKRWTKFFCAITPWKKALRKYWIETRAKPEVELCEHIIKDVEEFKK